jgi:hypothetical protein
METPLSGKQMLQLAFGFAKAKSELSPHEQEFMARAQPVFDQAVRDEYSVAMLWGLLLQYIDERKIIGAAQVWWDEHAPVDVSSRTAKRNFRVADHFHKQLFTTYGVSRLELVLQWGKLKHLKIPKAVDPGAIPIDFIENGQHVTKAFKDCTFTELQHAVHPPVTHRQPKPDSGTEDDPNLPAITKRYLEIARNRLVDVLGDDDDQMRLRVRWSGRKDENPYYSFDNIQEDSLPNVLQILNDIWKEIADEIAKGKLPFPDTSQADARTER